MSEIRAELPASVTHAYRAYTLVGPAVPWADAHLTIQVGRRGPRGGMGCLCVESYDVQEEDGDPEGPLPLRVFLLAKQTPAGTIYRVVVPDRGFHLSRLPLCTCDGWGRWGSCKHNAALEHAVHVRGWKPHATGDRALAGTGGPGL